MGGSTGDANVPGLAHRREPQARGAGGAARVAGGRRRPRRRRVVLISFPSARGYRLVKRLPRRWLAMTKKPVMATDEQQQNARSLARAPCGAARPPRWEPTNEPSPRLPRRGRSPSPRPRALRRPPGTSAAARWSSGYDLGLRAAGAVAPPRGQALLELESASCKTPERVEIRADPLLGMEPPPRERIVPSPTPTRPTTSDPPGAPAPRDRREKP